MYNLFWTCITTAGKQDWAKLGKIGARKIVKININIHEFHTKTV